MNRRVINRTRPPGNFIDKEKDSHKIKRVRRLDRNQIRRLREARPWLAMERIRMPLRHTNLQPELLGAESSSRSMWEVQARALEFIEALGTCFQLS
ncbi:hypothetical protein PoB_003424400 [Plakobranchus ocellatus]|uniref:Uncharacterized protein n=1 Tax=Plakobranchus ocellatus TaxID=259542 RepID=A0AAV4ANF8_9GAST|nr:hypothetical protein PoB_003424400 [Plakobranchus ocellatus]